MSDLIEQIYEAHKKLTAAVAAANATNPSSTSSTSSSTSNPTSSSTSTSASSSSSSSSSSSLPSSSSIPSSISSLSPSYQFFLDSISSSSSSDSVKQLCADSIPQFVHFFPDLAEKAYNSLMDLCESDKLLIRLHAVRGLELLCVNAPNFTIRVVEVLLQLAMGSEEQREIATVKTILATLFGRDLTASFSALFTQIKELEELRPKLVEYCIEQLQKYSKQIGKDETLAKDIIVNGVKGILSLENGVEGKELKQLLAYLLKMKVMKGDESFNAQLGTILSNQAKLNQDFNPTNAEAVQQFITALQQVGFYKKRGVDNGDFLVYFISKILPVLDQASDENRVNLFRAFANATASTTSKTAKQIFAPVWAAAKNYLPLTAIPLPTITPAPFVPSETEAVKGNGAAAASPAAASSTSATSSTGGAPAKPNRARVFSLSSTDVHYSILEAFLIALHQLSSLSPDSARTHLGLFEPTGQPSDFISDGTKTDATNRFNQAAASAQAYLAVVKEAKEKLTAEHKATPAENKPLRLHLLGERNKIERNSKAAGGVVALFPPLLGKVPSFQTNIQGSWKGAKAKEKKTTGSEKKKEKAGTSTAAGEGEKGKKKGKKGAAATAAAASGAGAEKKKGKKGTGKEEQKSNEKGTKKKGQKQPNQQQQQQQQQQQSNASSKKNKKQSTNDGQPPSGRKAKGGNQEVEMKQQNNNNSNNNNNAASKKNKKRKSTGGDVPEKQQQKQQQQRPESTSTKSAKKQRSQQPQQQQGQQQQRRNSSQSSSLASTAAQQAAFLQQQQQMYAQQVYAQQLAAAAAAAAQGAGYYGAGFGGFPAAAGGGAGGSARKGGQQQGQQRGGRRSTGGR